ncbi:MAG: branched-chain amino acid ABC transporter permease [Acutalibacteraceae bacterium]|jgi:branched-chain amino acid transport system permease protein
MKKKITKSTRTNLMCYGVVLLAFAVLFPLQQTGMINHSIGGQLVPICTYIVMAISLNLTVGVLGELSLGHAGFMSVGAFTGVIAAAGLESTVASGPLRLLLALIIGGICAGIAGFLIGIPVLRLRGDYLAIVTLAFGEIIKNIVNCLYVGLDKHGLHISMKDAASLKMENGRILLNGPQGAAGITKLASLTAGVLLILFALFVVLNMINSRTGRAITAIRDNRIAAESVGISITRYKLTAFITSAALAGMAGTLYAMNFSTISAKKFDFNTSILILVFVVLGGMGNIFGSIISTAVLYMIPELLREFSEYRMLIYAIILILVMLATNSPRLKGFFGRVFDTVLRRGGKGGERVE